MRCGAALGTLLLLACLAACGDHATAPYPASVPPTPADAAVGPGDLFDVRVFGEADLSGPYQVGADGFINFPLIGTVAVDGKTPTADTSGTTSRPATPRPALTGKSINERIARHGRLAGLERPTSRGLRAGGATA